VARNWVFNRFCERITDQLLGLTCAFSVDDLSVCGVLEGWGSTIELHPHVCAVALCYTQPHQAFEQQFPDLCVSTGRLASGFHHIYGVVALITSK
jgi:hypothetical protein